MLHYHSFGDSPAAIVIAKILNEINADYVKEKGRNGNKLTRKVGGLLNNFRYFAEPIKSRYVLDLVYHDYLIKCESLVHPKLINHMKTLITTIYRDIKRKNNIMESTKKKHV